MFCFYYIDILKIIDFYCNDCYSPSSFQQLIYTQTAQSPYFTNTENLTFYLDSFYCNNCSQSQTNIIYIDAYDATPITVSVINVFINSSSCDNGMIYLSQAVNLQTGLLENITVFDSFAYGGGIIGDNHASGTLKIKNMISNSNFAKYAGISSFFIGQNKGVILEVYNLSIIGSSNILGCFFSSLVPYSKIKLENIVFDSISSAIIFSNIAANVSGLFISHGSGIQLSNSQVYGIRIIFEEINGNAVVLNVGSVFYCNYCRVANLVDGPAINMLNSVISISNSVFVNISSFSPGMVLYMNFCNTKNVFFNCTFSECSSTGGGLMDISGSSLIISYCVIKENKSTASSPGIVITSSDLVVAFSVFSNQNAELGAFINMATNSNLTVTSSRFYNGTSSISGGAISSSMSVLYLINSVFYNNSANEGGALYGITLSYFYLMSNVFEENVATNGASIYFIGENITISNSNFYCSYNKAILSMIYTQNAGILAMNLTKLTGNMVPGLASYYTNLLFIENSEFSNLQGAIELYSVSTSKKFLISDCVFKNNRKEGEGSALMLTSISLVLSNIKFFNNSATSGGAVYYSCSESCQLQIIKNEFKSNSANNKGAGIFYECPNFGCSFVISNSLFENNHAGTEGGSVK